MGGYAMMFGAWVDMDCIWEEAFFMKSGLMY